MVIFVITKLVLFMMEGFVQGRTRVSSFGQKVLEKIERTRESKLAPDGSLKAGRLSAPANLVAELKALDLLRVEGGRASLTPAGKSFLRRLRHLQKNCRGPKSLFPQDPFKAQHAIYRVEEARTAKRTDKIVRNLGESPLSWLMKRKDKAGRPFLSEDQYEAGEKLSRDYEYAGLLSRTTTYYDGVPISSKGGAPADKEQQTLTQIAARQRVSAALDHVGPGLSDILVRVCCHHEGLEMAEKTLSWPTRSGKLVLTLALDRLADHYCLKEPNR